MTNTRWTIIDEFSSLFTNIISAFGVSGMKGQEIIEIQNLANTTDICGVIFMHERSMCGINLPNVLTDQNLFFTTKDVTDISAIQALQNIFFNINDISLGQTLAKLKKYYGSNDEHEKDLTITLMKKLRKKYNRLMCANTLRMEAIQSSKIKETYHCVGYMCVGDRVYEFDGNKQGPIDHGPVSGNSWLDVVKAAIMERTFKVHKSYFKIIALTPDAVQGSSEELGKDSDPSAVDVNESSVLTELNQYLKKREHAKLMRKRRGASSAGAEDNPQKRKKGKMMEDKPFLKLIRVSFAAEDGIRCRFGRTLKDDDKDSFELAVPSTYETIFYNHKRVTEVVDTFLSHFPKPTLPYSIAWAVLMKNRDLIGITSDWADLVFILSIYTRIKPLQHRKYPSVLVLSPTRDSAAAFYSELSEYRATDVKRALCCDDSDQSYQSIDIVVGTPDEILLLSDCWHLNLREVKYLVLDEVEGLLGTKHQDAVTSIVTKLPKQRRTVLKSETWTESVGTLARSHMRDPVLLDDITHYIKEVADGEDSDDEAAELPGLQNVEAGDLEAFVALFT